MAGEARRSEAEEGARGREAGARLALLDALLNALSDLGEGVFVHDGERIIYVNEAEARNTGYGVEELAAMPGLGGLVVPEERAMARERLLRRLREGTGQEHYETTLIHKSGRRVEIEA